MSAASLFPGLIKSALFLPLGLWLSRRVLSSQWRRRWGQERTFLASIFVFFYVIRLGAEMLDHLPLVGPFFAREPFDPLLKRIDPDSPWSSLAGWLLADLAPWVILGATILLLVWLRPGKAVTPLLWLILWPASYLGSSALVSALGLPSRTEANFASFHRAVLHRIGPCDLSGSALAALGSFALLVFMAVLLHLAGCVHRRARREFPRDTLAPYRPAGFGTLGAVIGYVGLLAVIAGGLTALAIPDARDPSTVSLRSWLVFSVLFALSTLVVTLIFQRLRGPEYLFQGLALRRSRLQDWLLGLMLSFLLVGILTVAGEFLGWWRFEGVREVSWTALLGYLGFFLLDAISSELAFRGYVLQKLNTAIDFWPAVALAALLQLPFQPLPPRAPWIGVPGFFVAGLLGGALFRLSRSLWLPIAFRCGWNLALGPLFGHPVSGLICGQFLVLESKDAPAWQSGGAFGPEGGAISLAVLLLGLWMLRWHSLNEPLTSG